MGRRRSLKSRLMRAGVQGFLRASAALCSREELERLALGSMSALGRAVAWARRVRPRQGAREGVTVCEVALRSSALPAEDLVPAHVRARSRGD